MTCVRCGKERLTIHGLCNDCNNEVDTQIGRNLPFAEAMVVGLKAKLNWESETNGTRPN